MRGRTREKAVKKIKDPITFAVWDDDTGNLLDEGSLLDVEYSATDSGSLLWESNQLFVDASDAEFHLAINQQYVAPNQGGTLDLVIENGLVSTSYSDGAFSSLLLIRSVLQP